MAGYKRGYDEVKDYYYGNKSPFYIEGTGIKGGADADSEVILSVSVENCSDMRTTRMDEGFYIEKDEYITTATFTQTATNIEKLVYYVNNFTLRTVESANDNTETFESATMGAVYKKFNDDAINDFTLNFTKQGTQKRTYNYRQLDPVVEYTDPPNFPALGLNGGYRSAQYKQMGGSTRYIANFDAYVFRTRAQAIAFLNGEDVKPIRPEEGDTGNKQHYYYYCRATASDDFLFRRELDIKCDDAVKVVGYYLSSDELPTNIKFKTKPSDAEIDLTNTFINENGVVTNKTEFTAITGSNGLYMGEKKASKYGIVYKAFVDTNIKIYDNEQDAIDGLDNDDTDGDKDNDSGEDVDEQTNPTPDMYLPLCHAHVLTEAQMTTLANLIFTDDLTEIEEILLGLKMYGNNPIDFFINSYAVPFDPRVFCTYEDVQSMYFGSYTASVPNSAISKNNKLLEIANCYINGTYRDWRDYETRYYIYLPYCGVQILDTEKYLYKTLSIKMAFDIRTGNIKYYFFANSKLLDTYEGSCGVNMALMSTNTASKSWDIVSNVVGLAGDVVGIATKKSSVGSGINSILNTSKEIFTDAQKHLSGNQSPSTSVFDVNYVYMIIEEPEFIKSPNLENVFGKPDGAVSNIGLYSGYIEVINTQLKTSATEEEQKEILALLEKGVVI